MGGIIHLMGENLGKDGGGMLGKLLPLFKMGLGESIGDDRQWLPWILISMILVAPSPVRYLESVQILGEVLRRPALFTTAAAVLWLIPGEAAALGLNSYRISPQELMETYDFSFKFDTLSAALKNLLEKY